MSSSENENIKSSSMDPELKNKSPNEFESENNGAYMMGPYGPYKVKDVAIGVGAIAGCATVGVLAAPAIISAVGFGSAGVTAGSTAAAWMSSSGPIAAGSLYASLQSAGAAGLGAAGLGAAAATGGVVGGAAVGGVAAVAGQGRTNGPECEGNQGNEEPVGRISSIINASSSAANNILVGSLHYGVDLTKATVGYIGNYYGGETAKESSNVQNSAISPEHLESDFGAVANQHATVKEDQADRFAFVKDSASFAASSLYGSLQYGIDSTRATIGSAISNYYGERPTQEPSTSPNK